ncbi:proteoglycan 4 isoform X1 [Drosophila albomicans]|uniref:Proteoglycan 4 isoform X1 n=1 Tax=Drosophila albomicans TaxID=7291 RepID=A0A6P8WNE3_DROAB|nr:proteoglycan 4 isoform X1 [Drosophila albomicans]
MPNAEPKKGKSKASKAKEATSEAEATAAVKGKAGADAAAKAVRSEAGAEEATATEAGASTADELEATQSKVKTRSRFSAAFRSLSKSKTPKKEQEQQPVASGAEDVTSIGDISTDSGIKAGQKKKSLTRRLLLGSLKKSKVRPHSIATSDDISVRSSSRERLGGGVSGSLSGAGGGGNTLPSPSSSTLQITISGKKVETVKGKPKSKSKSQSQSRGAVSETTTDYLTPTTATATTIAVATGGDKATSTTTTATATQSTTGNSRTTKLIVAKVSKEPVAKKKLKAAQTAAQQQQQQHTLPLLEEKIVITESKRDTPPRERAPAKPSRANIQSSASSGAVRKQSRHELMQQQQQQQQRGHRLFRPLTTFDGPTTASPAQPVTSPATPPSPEPLPPTYPPPPPPQPPSSTIVVVSLSDVEESSRSTDNVSLAESASQHIARSPSPHSPHSTAPQVRFAVGSAVRGPAADAYEAALAAAASQQPSSNEETSDSSLRRLSFAQQQFALSDHDSIEGRRETLRYQSVASDYNEDDLRSDDEEAAAEEQEEQKVGKPMPAFGDLTMAQEMEPTIMAPSSEKREHLYKILVIGELGTGKTSFIKRYVHQFFSQNYRATIGVDFALKVLHWDANTIVRLQLWDIAGQERFGNMTRVYYKEAVGAFIVFDVTRSGTFDCVSKWKEDLDSKVQLPDGSPIPCILLANKCDQEKQGIVTQPERMDEYVRENGFAGWFETSAKENINIDEAARALVNKILINDKLIAADANDEEKFNLSTAGEAGAEAKNKCSC